jgi:hypothetical protein
MLYKRPDHHLYVADAGGLANCVHGENAKPHVNSGDAGTGLVDGANSAAVERVGNKGVPLHGDPCYFVCAAETYAGGDGFRLLHGGAELENGASVEQR